MTDTASPTTPPALDATAPGAPKRGNTIGLVALIVAVVGFILAVIPATSFLAWIPLLAAFVLAIIGLTRKGQKKGSSITALILSVVGWIISIIVTLAVVAAAVVTPGTVEVQKSTTAASQPDKNPVVGDTVTNSDKVAFTVTAVKCGITSASTGYSDVTPKGDFCTVAFTVKNGSDKSISLSNSSVSGYIGKAKYETETTVGNLGDDSVYTSINPGLSIDSKLYIDVPKGSALDSVKLSTAWGFGSGDVIVDVK